MSAMAAATAARCVQRQVARNPALTQKGRDDLFVLLGLARARAVDQTPARRNERSDAAQQANLFGRRSAGRSSGVRRHLMSGSRRTVPRPEHGASTSTRSNAAVRKGTRRLPRHEGCARGAPACDESSRPESRCAVRARRWPRPAPSVGLRGEGQRLPARRGAGVEDARSPRDALDQLRDDLRRFVLDEAEPVAEGRRRGDAPARHRQALWRHARRLRLDAVGLQAARASSTRSMRSRFAASVTAGF